MRLKGYCKGKRKVKKNPAKIYEIDCGMGMTEIRKEIESFNFPARMDCYQPAWKKPVILGSLFAAAGIGSLSFMLIPYSAIFGGIFIMTVAWIAFVCWANR